MNLIEIFTILIVHYVADFVLQTEKQAQGKSNNWNDLLGHTLTYSIIWIIPIGILTIYNISCKNIEPILYGLIFFIVTFVCHTVTDYFTSRFNKKLLPERKLIDVAVYRNQSFVYFPKGENYHKFFVGIGFDQLLHYIQLFLTYYYLKTL